jgi:hypothetical protein
MASNHPVICNEVFFHGIPLKIYSNGTVAVNPLSQIWLRAECREPGVHTEFGKFLLANAPAVPVMTLKAIQRDYPEIVNK